MIDATTEPVPADINEAARKIAQAMKHAESAEQCVDNESAYILLYSAVHKALAAVLISIGLRVGSGERGHVRRGSREPRRAVVPTHIDTKMHDFLKIM